MKRRTAISSDGKAVRQLCNLRMVRYANGAYHMSSPILVSSCLMESKHAAGNSDNSPGHEGTQQDNIQKKEQENKANPQNVKTSGVRADFN